MTGTQQAVSGSGCVGFFTVNAQGKLLEVKDAFWQGLGTVITPVPGGMVGIRELLSPSTITHWEQMWDVLTLNGYAPPQELSFWGAPGAEVRARVGLTALRDGQGTVAVLVEFLPKEDTPPSPAEEPWAVQARTMPEPMAVLDAQFCYRVFNRAYQDDFKARFGTEPSIGASLIDLLAHMPDAQAMQVHQWGCALRGETVVERVEQLSAPGDMQVWEATYAPLSLGDDVIENGQDGAYLVFRDMTPQRHLLSLLEDLEQQCQSSLERQKKSEAEVGRLNEELGRRFDTTFEQAAVGMAHIERNGAFLRVNQKYCDILGYTRQELVGLDFIQLTYAEDRERDKELHEKLFQREIEQVTVEKRYVRKNQELIWVHLTVKAIPDASGQVDYNLVVAEDVTERKQTELALRASEERFRLLADASPAQIFDMAPDGKLRFVNQTTIDFYGPERVDDIMLGRWASDVHPDDLGKITEILKFSMENRSAYRAEVRARRKDGVYRWLLTTGTPSCYSNGEFYGLIGYNLDITALKEAELALRESEERFRIMADVSPVHVFNLAPSGQVRFVNRTMLDFYGPERLDDFYTGNWHDLVHPDDAERLHAAIQRAFEQHQGYRLEVRFRNRQGEYRWLLASAEPSFYPNGELHSVVGSAIDITDIKQAELAARESEERFRIMADASSMHIFNVTPAGCTEFLNQAAIDFFEPGALEAFIRGESDYLVHPDDVGALHAMIGQALETHQGYRLELRFRNKAGEYRWLLSSVQPSFYPDGELYGLIGSAMDITDIKLTEFALRESEERFRILADASPLMIYDLAPDGSHRFINQTTREFFGPEMAQEIMTGNWLKMIHPDDCEETLQAVRHAVETHGDYTQEVRLLRRDGEYRWCFSSAACSFYPNGDIYGMVGSFIDITERKQAELALRESEERFRIMADASPMQIYDVGPDGKLRFVNKTARDFYGPENEAALMNDGWLDFVHPEDKERMMKPVPLPSELEKVGWDEFRIRRQDGEYRWVMTFTSPSFYPNGELHGLVGSAIDITERKLMEEAWQQSESRWREMANAVPIILWVANAQGESIFMNDRWYEYSGLTSVQSLGIAGLQAIHPDDRHRMIEHWVKHLEIGEANEIEARYISASGQYRWHLTRAVPVKDINGVVLNWYGSSLDIQDRRMMEQELSKARDIAEDASKKKSQFLANMSHELRTPLNAVIGFSDMLGRGLGGSLNEKQLGYVEHISTSGRHLLAMVNDILDISKAEAGRIELVLQYVDLEPFIQQLKELISFSAEKSAVQVEFDIQPGLAGLVVDPDRLKQIMLNLISNAIKFNHVGGKVYVFMTRSPDNRWVLCEIQDTGIGIPQSKLGQLFNEFYQVDSSNARRYEGTGLGLALTKRLVELHHGSIGVESQENVGSIFTFKLPVNPYAVCAESMNTADLA